MVYYSFKGNCLKGDINGRRNEAKVKSAKQKSGKVKMEDGINERIEKIHIKGMGAWKVSEMMKESQKKGGSMMQTRIGKRQILQIKTTEAECVIVVVSHCVTYAQWPQASSALHLLSVFIWFLCTAVIFPPPCLPPRHPAAFVFPLQQQNGLVLSSNLDLKG